MRIRARLLVQQNRPLVPIWIGGGGQDNGEWKGSRKLRTSLLFKNLKPVLDGWDDLYHLKVRLCNEYRVT